MDAPVLRPFVAPACRWCPGNRGIDYATRAGVSVRAIGSGRVSFAGRVGRDLFVTVTHPDGLRSTYAFLGAVLVSRGATVFVGEPVGVTAGHLHLGIRRGDGYIDPELLLGPVRTRRARLVPSRVPASRRVR
ncbi:MAG TPA: M23 family metallopeptidase [Acidimicrobiales bacterium]